MATKGRTEKELWEALEGLDDDLLDPDLPEALVEEELHQIGLDPGALGKRCSDFIARVKVEERLSWQTRARERRAVLEARTTKVATPATMDRQAILARLDELRGLDPKVDTAIRVAARKRKPEQSSDEELLALLEDMEMLRALGDDREE